MPDMSSTLKPTTRKVCIIGPNLLDQSKGQFHVHAAGCADTKKAQYRMHRDDVRHPYSVTSKQDVVELIYSDMIADEPGSTWEDFLDDDIHFFPCVHLPYATPDTD
jgi:hypothetical protein